jgi:ApbE superfamily uncharacterized protein (UPF0280 family)
MAAQARLLPDGRRLHLHHGPIDLIVEADPGARAAAYRLAVARFAPILDELVAELPDLRRADAPPLRGVVARRMQAATAPYAPVFITPMAAVAGAVADEVLAAMATLPGLLKAHVNNGGDIAFHLASGQSVTAAMAVGRAVLAADQPFRGIATSGWRGRSHSLGIADAVTVIAHSGAGADAAATLIANAVDLPGHAAITRQPARALAPDSDLGDRLVTVDVGPLRPDEIDAALERGVLCAAGFLSRGLIGGACLALAGAVRALGTLSPDLSRPELIHA